MMPEGRTESTGPIGPENLANAALIAGSAPGLVLGPLEALAAITSDCLLLDEGWRLTRPKAGAGPGRSQ